MTFPKIKLSNTTLYYFIAACQAAWFTETVWYFYFRQFTDYTTMGIVFAILNIFWIAFEIPTGVIADKMGRKFSTILGTGIVTLGLFLTALAQGFWIWVAGLLIQNLGRAFVSGALEALIYDDLKAKGLEKSFDRIVATKSRIVTITYALAIISGGFLGHINLRIPYFIFSFVSLASTLASMVLIENRKKITNKLSKTTHFFNFTIEGLKQFKLPAVRPFLLLSWTLLFTYFVFDWGLTKPAMSVKFGYFEREQSIIFSLTSVLVFFLLGKLPLIRQKLGELFGLYVFNVILAASFLLAVFPLGVFGFIPIVIIEITGNFSDSWISITLNRHIDSQYRATALSALQMFGRLPYLLVNPLVGHLIDSNYTNIVFIIIAGIIALAISINILQSRLKKQLNFASISS